MKTTWTKDNTTQKQPVHTCHGVILLNIHITKRYKIIVSIEIKSKAYHNLISKTNRTLLNRGQL